MGLSGLVAGPVVESGEVDGAGGVEFLLRGACGQAGTEDGVLGTTAAAK